MILDSTFNKSNKFSLPLKDRISDVDCTCFAFNCFTDILPVYQNAKLENYGESDWILCVTSIMK